jgi:hypothetical protein
MRITKPTLLLIVAALFVCLLHIPSLAEERFGPWVYYAPYYFPPGGACEGVCLSPASFLPTYESPNPPEPVWEKPPRPPRDDCPPAKMASRRPHTGPSSVGAPPPRQSGTTRISPIEKPRRAKASDQGDSLKSILRQKSRPADPPERSSRSNRPEPLSPSAPGDVPR